MTSYERGRRDGLQEVQQWLTAVDDAIPPDDNAFQQGGRLALNSVFHHVAEMLATGSGK